MVDFSKIDRVGEADNVRLVASCALLDAVDETYHLIRIPQYALVTNVIVDLISPFGTTSTITVGFDGNGETADPDAFFLNVDIDPDGSILTRSLAGSTGVNRGGKWFGANNGTITLTLVEGNAPATASVRLFAEYKVVYGSI